MAVTQADIDTLEAVRNSGILTVRFDGPPSRMVTYQNMADVEHAIEKMKLELAAQQGSSASTYILAATRKGL